VRLEPLITQANELLSSLRCLEAFARAVWKIGNELVNGGEDDVAGRDYGCATATAGGGHEHGAGLGNQGLGLRDCCL